MKTRVLFVALAIVSAGASYANRCQCDAKQ